MVFDGCADSLAWRVRRTVCRAKTSPRAEQRSSRIGSTPKISSSRTHTSLLKTSALRLAFNWDTLNEFPCMAWPTGMVSSARSPLPSSDATCQCSWRSPRTSQQAVSRRRFTKPLHRRSCCSGLQVCRCGRPAHVLWPWRSRRRTSLWQIVATADVCLRKTVRPRIYLMTTTLRELFQRRSSASSTLVQR